MPHHPQHAILHAHPLINDSDYNLDLALTTPASVQSVRVAATALVPTCFVATTAAGSAIGSLTGTMAELANQLGTYRATFAGATITTALSGVTDGTDVYITVTIGTSYRQTWVVAYYKTPRVG